MPRPRAIFHLSVTSVAKPKSDQPDHLMATALGGDAIPPSRFIGTDTIMNS